MSKYSYKEPGKKLQNKLLRHLLSEYKTVPGYTRYDKIFLSKFNHSQEDIDKALNVLTSYELLELSLSDPLNIKIILLPKAFTYFQNKKKDNFQFWFPVSISILALITSILALLNS